MNKQQIELPECEELLYMTDAPLVVDEPSPMSKWFKSLTQEKREILRNQYKFIMQYAIADHVLVVGLKK